MGHDLLKALLLSILGLWSSAGPVGAAENVPIIFVPGILGSELADQNGTTVWGPLLASLRNFQKLEFPRDPAADGIHATGLVNEVQILGPFKINQYSGLLGTLKDLGFKEGEDLFLFPYDWRQSNFDTAAELCSFVRGKPALKGRYRILTHSMGGLVARIFLDQCPEGKRVDRLITMGTPHLGSQSALRPMLEGLGGVQNTLAGGKEGVRKVAFSLPSLYEMLPFYADCCVRERPGQPLEKVDLLLDATWNGFTWLPGDERSQAARERRQAVLRRARELRDIMRKGMPEGITLFPVAGAVLSTPSQVVVSEDRASIRWGFEASGDGTVVEGSAAAGSLLDARVAIRRHSTIFEDDHVKIQLARLLVDNREIEQFAGVVTAAEITTRSGKQIGLSRVELSAEPSVAKVGEQVRIALSVFDKEKGQKIVDLAPFAVLSLEGGKFQEEPILLRAAPDETLQGTARLEKAGTYRVSVTLPGVDGVFEEHILVTSN